MDSKEWLPEEIKVTRFGLLIFAPGVFLLAAWPLGLGEEAAALWAAHRPGRPKK